MGIKALSLSPPADLPRQVLPVSGQLHAKVRPLEAVIHTTVNGHQLPSHTHTHTHTRSSSSRLTTPAKGAEGSSEPRVSREQPSSRAGGRKGCAAHQPVHCLSPRSTTCFLSMPAPGAGPPRPSPFPPRGALLRRKASSPSLGPRPPPFSGADSELHPHCQPSLRPTRHPLQMAHLSAMPAQACAGMGLVSLRRGRPEPWRLWEGLLATPEGGFTSLQRPAESGGSEQAWRKRTEECEMSESRG